MYYFYLWILCIIILWYFLYVYMYIYSFIYLLKTRDLLPLGANVIWFTKCRLQMKFPTLSFTYWHIARAPNAWWCLQMETFPRHWPFVQGIHWWPLNSPHKGHWRGASMFYYDVTVMVLVWLWYAPPAIVHYCPWSQWQSLGGHVLELMQVHPKERLGRVIFDSKLV